MPMGPRSLRAVRVPMLTFVHHNINTTVVTDRCICLCSHWCLENPLEPLVHFTAFNIFEQYMNKKNMCLILWPSAADFGSVCQFVGSSAVWGRTLSLQPGEGNSGDSLLYPWFVDAALWPSLHLYCCPGGPTYCRGECWTVLFMYFKLFF